MREFLLSIVAFCILCMPMLGMWIGYRRYKKYGKEIRQKMEQEYQDAQEKGGIASLYYKQPGKRVFKRTFGTPVLIGFLGGLISLIVFLTLI